MKKLEKEQLPKVIALGVLTVVLLGYAGFTWLGHGGAPATPAVAATPHPVASKPAAPAGPTVADKVLALPPINHENPFVPAIAIAASPAPHAAPTNPAVAKPKGAVQVASLSDNLNGPALDGLPGLPPMPGGPPPGVAPVPAEKPVAPAAHPPVKTAPAPPQPPAVLVTGILEGQENVAILKWSDTQRQVVRVGDHLDGGYVVKAIRSDAVLLALGDSQWVMRLGTAAKR